MLSHEEWLFKAEHDLESAKFLMTSQKQFYDIAIYHTQQCAEKPMKAFLAFKEQEIDKVHNLMVLVNQCSSYDSEFESLKQSAVFLNPYATIYRYPEGDLLPPKKDVDKAMELAETIYDFVKSKILIKQ